KVKVGGVLRHPADLARAIDPRRIATDRRGGRRVLCCWHVRSFSIAVETVRSTAQFALRPHFLFDHGIFWNSGFKHAQDGELKLLMSLWFLLQQLLEENVAAGRILGVRDPSRPDSTSLIPAAHLSLA